MEHERFQLQNIAKTIEMAASSSKMLQIARKPGRTADPKKMPKAEKESVPQPFLTLSPLNVDNTLQKGLTHKDGMPTHVCHTHTIMYIYNIIYVYILDIIY